MGFALLNVGSLVLGLVAWGLPLVSWFSISRGTVKNGAFFVAGSLGACAVSLYFQIAYTHHLVEIADWSALADTSYATKKVSAILLVATLILNAAPLVLQRWKNK